MSEWLKEMRCKRIGSAYAGSNPAPPTGTRQRSALGSRGRTRQHPAGGGHERARTGHGDRDSAARPQLSRQLLLNRREVDPGALAADQPAREVEDVQEARLNRATATLEPERPARGRGVEDRLVDHVVRAVAAPDGLEAPDAKLGEEVAVERGDLVAA